jgi:glutathione-regulated potassium-efflux system ancillary protein KefF
MRAMAAEILVLLAHPDLAQSRVNRALADVARQRVDRGVAVRDLYALYPDYLIDVAAEQQALAAARTLVWLHPVQWYAMPALMKLWVDEVLAFGWAYGPGGTALAGKALALALSTGGTEAAYSAGGSHRRPFDAFLPPYLQTAALCGMRTLPARVFHGAHQAGDAEIAAHAQGFGDALDVWLAEARGAAAAPAAATATAPESA